MQNNERLLKLYESGLPVWAIFLPTYGLYYRPWMRRVTWILFIAVSIFSMACGFYDLYKNVPHVDMVRRPVDMHQNSHVSCYSWQICLCHVACRVAQTNKLGVDIVCELCHDCYSMAR